VPRIKLRLPFVDIGFGADPVLSEFAAEISRRATTATATT
jgi:hypothetical protein